MTLQATVYAIITSSGSVGWLDSAGCESAMKRLDRNWVSSAALMPLSESTDIRIRETGVSDWEDLCRDKNVIVPCSK